MKINKIENNKYNTPFGTYMGLNIQEKIIMGKHNNAFSRKQLEILSKIEEDGLDAVLEISDKLKITRVGKKSTLTNYKCLTVGDLYNNVVLDTLEKVYRPNNDNTKLYFNFSAFAKLFDEEFNLPEKIKKCYESFKV